MVLGEQGGSAIGEKTGERDTGSVFVYIIEIHQIQSLQRNIIKYITCHLSCSQSPVIALWQEHGDFIMN